MNAKSGRTLFAAGLITAALASGAIGQQDEKLGKVNFPTSCDPKVQAEFDRGVAMLHSYWFLIARRDCDRELGPGNAAIEKLPGHFFQGLHIADVLLLLDLEERRAGDVDVARLDELAHLAIEERQEQGADVLAVDVGVGKENDFAVA